jgi:hypothetical protein
MVRTMTVLLDKAPLHQGLSDYLKSDPKLLEACKKNPDCAALLDAKDSKPAAAKPEEKK